MKNSNECRYCKETLTVMESGCKRCLECHPINTKPPVQKKDDGKYVDVPWTDERIWASIEDKVRDMIEELTVTKTDIEDAPQETVDSAETIVIEPKSWREEAKELGIDLFQRKKADVLKDIEAKLTVPVGQ